MTSTITYSAASTKASGNRFDDADVKGREKVASISVITAPRDDRFERLQCGNRQKYACADSEPVKTLEAKAGCRQVDKININARRSGFANQCTEVDAATLSGACFLHLASGVHGYQIRPRPVRL